MHLGPDYEGIRIVKAVSLGLGLSALICGLLWLVLF
jgi:hypothetical protein